MDRSAGGKVNEREVVFTTEIPVDVEKNVHIALELSDPSGKIWLVERNVAIDKVY